MRYSLCILFILPFFVSLKAEVPSTHKWTTKDPFEQKVFIENLGQYSLTEKVSAADILFGARQDGLQYFFTKDGFWIKYVERVERTEKEKEKFVKLIGEKEGKEKESDEENMVKYKFVDHFYRMEFEGAGINTTFLSEDKVTQYYIFYTEQKEHIKANAFKKIIYKDLYPDIDMEFYFPEDKQGFKYNLIVHPGADISQIKINYPGNENLSLSNEGNLVIRSSFGDFIDHAPIAYDEKTKRPVDCSFTLEKNTVSFSAQNYDRSKGLVIDPWTNTPVFSGANSAYDVDWDLAGNVYVYGGVTPYQLIKFNAAGAQQWTYTTNFLGSGGGLYYGDFAINRYSGSAYIVDGFNVSGALVQKIDPAGTFVASSVHNNLFQEMWRVVYDRCSNQVVIAGGGTSSPSYTGATYDTSLSAASLQIVNVINAPGGYHDIWGLASDVYGSAYFASAKTHTGGAGFDNILYKVPMPALTPFTYSVATAFNFEEVASTAYLPGYYITVGANGFNGMSVSNKTLYMYDSYVLQKWDATTGTMISSANINGSSKSTMYFGGLASDACDHIFLGSGNTIQQYDGISMTQTGVMTAAGPVYDVVLGANNMLYSCGKGFVTATQVSLLPCSILQSQQQIACINSTGSATLTISGGIPPYNISWNTIPVQTGSVVTNLPPGTYVATSKDNSCPPLLKTDSIIINHSDTASVSPVINNAKCNGTNTGAITIQYSGTAVPTYTWSNGSSAPALSNLYAGTYSVIIGDGNNCGMAFSFNVKEPPPLTYTLLPGAIKCFGDTTSISLSVGGGTSFSSGSAYNVTWNAPYALGFTVHGVGAGNYGGFITDSMNCTQGFSSSLIQASQAVPVFNCNSVCFGSPIQFTDQSTGGSFNWSWDFNDGTFASTQNPGHLYSTAGNYTVTLTLATTSGCTTTVSHSVTVYDLPTADFAGDIATGCPSQFINFKDKSSGKINSWNWNFGNGNTYSGQSPPDAIVYNNTSFNLPVTYSVSLSVISSDGCSSRVVKNNYITVYPSPKAGFEYMVDGGGSIYENNAVHFYNRSLGASSIQYNLGDVFENSPASNNTNVVNPVHLYQFGDSYTYYVTQTVENRYGCKDSVTIPLVIKPTFSFFIPNSFSPNGNGVNEYFKGTGTGIDNSTFNMLVFDRWGEIIFRSKDLDTGWDGKLNGSEAANDAYAWKVSFKDVDGYEHEYRGMVSIVK